MANVVTVYLERVKERFRIVRVKNALLPTVGDFLEDKEVKELIRRGIQVIVDLPRNR